MGPCVVKEKILESEHTNSVSMPSALAVGAGTDEVLFAARAGRVKLRLPLLAWTAAGACPGCWDEAGTDMMGCLCEHCRRGDGEVYVSWARRRPALVKGCCFCCCAMVSCAVVASRGAAEGCRSPWLRNATRYGRRDDVEFQPDQRIVWTPRARQTALRTDSQDYDAVESKDMMQLVEAQMRCNATPATPSLFATAT